MTVLWQVGWGGFWFISYLSEAVGRMECWSMTTLTLQICRGPTEVVRMVRGCELQQHSLSCCKPNCWHNYPGRTGLLPRFLVALGKGEKPVPLIPSRVIASHIQIDPEGNVWCSAEFLQGRDFSCPRQFGQKAYIYKAAQSIPSFLSEELKHSGWKLKICVPSGHQYSIFCPANLSKPSKCCLRPAASQETSQFKTLAPSANSKPVLITSMRSQGNQEVRLYSNRVEAEKRLSQSSKLQRDLQKPLRSLCVTVASKTKQDLWLYSCYHFVL